MGEVVSLTIQLSAAGTSPGEADASGRGGDDGPISRDSLSRQSSRSAGVSSEQARSFSIASPAPCASAPTLAGANARIRQTVAVFIACPAACAPGVAATPAPPGTG